MLNILQCTGQLPITKNHLVQNVSSAKIKKFCSKGSPLPYAKSDNFETIMLKNPLDTLVRSHLELSSRASIIF